MSASIAPDTPKKNTATVLIADDSSAVRGLMSRYLNADRFLEVVAVASDGKEALELYKEHRPDFAILDIFMPGMDGIEALAKIREFDEKARVFMYSAIAKREAGEVFRSIISLGALDFMEKPSGAAEVQAFLEDLSQKMYEIGTRSGGRILAKPGEKAPIEKPLPQARPYPKLALLPKVLAIGSSTGGPQALMQVLKPLHGKCHIPIVITQHMPASFTSILAGQIQDETGFETYEAKEGQIIEGGKVYLAPGDYHMCFRKMVDGKVQVRLNQNPPVNFCRPAVDPMFESICDIYPENTLALILTGMGSDGLNGARKIVETGRNTLIAQDKSTSVVWGMPAAVAEAGLCHEILPLSRIPHKILTLMGR